MWKPLAVSVLSIGLIILGYFFYLQDGYSKRFGSEFVSAQASRVMASVGGDYSARIELLIDRQAEKSAAKEKLYVGLAGLFVSILGIGLYLSAVKAEAMAKKNEQIDDDSLAGRLAKNARDSKAKGWDLVE